MEHPKKSRNIGKSKDCMKLFLKLWNGLRLKAFSGMNCIKLAIQNCGKAIDEDAEIMFEVPKESLLTLGEFLSLIMQR